MVTPIIGRFLWHVPIAHGRAFPKAGRAALGPETDDKKLVKNRATWEFMGKVIPSKFMGNLKEWGLLSPLHEPPGCATELGVAVHPTAAHGPSTLPQGLGQQTVSPQLDSHFPPVSKQARPLLPEQGPAPGLGLLLAITDLF